MINNMQIIWHNLTMLSILDLLWIMGILRLLTSKGTQHHIHYNNSQGLRTLRGRKISAHFIFIGILLKAHCKHRLTFFSVFVRLSHRLSHYRWGAVLTCTWFTETARNLVNHIHTMAVFLKAMPSFLFYYYLRILELYYSYYYY